MDNARLEAESVRARVVSLVQVTSGVLAETDRFAADYVHHYAGDLNPSFDYERGERGILLAAHVTGQEPPLELAIDQIRRALCDGQNPFLIVGLLVEAAPATRPLELGPQDPILSELATWIAQHPGPQRKLLQDLRATWTARLADCAKGHTVSRTLIRAVSSPKLAGERDAWLAQLGLGHEPGDPAPAAAAAIERYDPLIVRTDPPRQPGAWLDRISIDATVIDVTDGSVTEIPARIERFAELTRIQLAHNKLVRLPPELCRLAKLASLDVRGNRLTALPDELGQLTTLTSLIVEENAGLAALPDSLCDLAKLGELAIGHTPITRLPVDFGRLASLRHLNLHGCQRLVRLPESFFALPSLDSLYLHGTRLPASDLARVRRSFPNAQFWNFFQ